MAGQHDASGTQARKAALALLHGVFAEARLLPEMLGEGALDRLVPADRARAQRLALEVLRNAPAADEILKPFLSKQPPLAVRNALRLGVVEIGGGAASYGVVSDLVTILAAGKRTRHFKGLANAVLRKLPEGFSERWKVRKVPKLPGWLRQPLVAAWSRDVVAAMEAVHMHGAPVDLSVKGHPQAVAQALGGTVLPTGSVRLTDAGQVSGLAGYDAGDWWVQDAAAALPVRMLGDVTGLSVLDLCAAPGGKTMQLAAAGAKVTAVDASAMRMERVADNLGRTGLRAEIVVRDAFEVAGQWDAVVLDAPCSATGTIRRHPDLPWAKDGSEFGALIAQQERMIDHALRLLKPGGRLVFCTCSLLPDEGEVQVEEALDRHPGLTMEAPEFEGIEPAWRSEDGGLRLRPDYWAGHGGMDGFYMACLRKA